LVDLEEFPPFRDLTRVGRDLLDQGLVRRRFAPATEILHKGKRVSGAYIVLRGSLRVFAIAPSGVEATLYPLNPGETCVLALNCLFNDLLYPAWSASESETEVAVVPGLVFRKLFENEPAIQNLTVQALSTAVFRLMHELEQVHFCTLEQRLANFILLRASSEGLLRMTQQEMADHLGTTREVVARLMRELVARSLVETQRGQVKITQAAGLAALLCPSPDISSLWQR